MTSRSQGIADLLTRTILDHRLVPGCKLGERELAEAFGVSRIVVRQALIRLADDGLVQIERNRGAFVAKPGIQEALELYDALTLVEQGVAAQLSDRLGPTGWAELRQHVERQRQAVEAGNDALADLLGQEFHTLFVRLSRNKVMQDIHAQLIRRTTLLRSLITANFDYCNLLDHHSRIIDLLEKGRLKPAMELIDTHHRAVVRGYIMDRAVFPEISVQEALLPYLHPHSADGGPDQAIGRKMEVGADTKSHAARRGRSHQRPGTTARQRLNQNTNRGERHAEHDKT
jgi:DNA-binding GntR family transcriptional regulator